MTERDIRHPDSIPFNKMTYEQFLAAHKKLKDSGQITVPYIRLVVSEQKTIALMQKLTDYGLQGYLNFSFGGVDVFVHSEEDFNKLKRFAKKEKHIIRLLK